MHTLSGALTALVLSASFVQAESIYLSEFQPPDGFRSTFSSLVSKYSNHEVVNDWHSFQDGNLMVFFTKNAHDLGQVPPFVHEVINVGEIPVRESFLKLEVVAGERTITLAFFYDDGRGDVVDWGCAAAVFLANSMSIMQLEEAREELPRCY